MLNRVVLVGHITQEITLRYTQEGKAVANLTMAVGRRRGENQKTDFIDVVVWEKLAELSANHVGKGHLIALVGRLQIHSYPSEGQVRRHAEVVADEIRFLKRPAAKEKPYSEDIMAT